MSDFLSRLVERNQGGRETIRPRLGSLFEPANRVGMAETQTIIPDTPTSPPPASPPQEAAPHQQENLEASTLQHTPERTATAGQPGPNPEPVLSHPPRPQNPGPEPVHDLSPVIPPIQHERHRQTITTDTAIPVLGAPTNERKITPEDSLVQGSPDPEPRAPNAVQSDHTHSDMQQDATTLSTTLPEATKRKATAFPPSLPSLEREPDSTQKTLEVVPSRTVSPLRINPDKPLSETTIRGSSVAPQMQPDPPLPSQAPEPPTIQVTIERIDVRAQMPERRQPQQPQRTRTRPQPALSLDDYLKQRGGSP
jgi:hypothetical protein